MAGFASNSLDQKEVLWFAVVSTEWIDQWAYLRALHNRIYQRFLRILHFRAVN